VRRDWARFFVRTGESPRELAVRVAAAFAIFGIVWMIASHTVLHAIGDDQPLVAQLELTFDWVFLLVASATIYLVAYRVAASLTRARSVLAAVVESVGDGLLVYGRDRTIVHANNAVVQMLGLRDDTVLHGMTAQQFAQRYHVAYLSGALVSPDELTSKRAFEEEGVFHYKAVLHPVPNRDLVYLSTAAGVRARSGERPELVVSVLHDITDSEHLEQLRDRFFMAAAHALKTPVAIIKANVQLTRRSSAADRPSLFAIERQCDRIDRLVQNLQIVSRARSGSLELFLREMDLAPLVVDTADELESLKWARAVRVEIEASPSVYGDRERLATVIRNLCHEALQDSVPKSTLALRLQMHDGKVELLVSYESIPVSERTFAGAESYDDTALSRAATATVIAAHGGEVGGEDLNERDGMRWIRLPVMEAPDEPLE
jgi:NtrC-family two-component system sensor histidine kinase KinB